MLLRGSVVTWLLSLPMWGGGGGGGQGFLPGAISYHRAAVGGGTLLGDTQPLASGSCRDVDCLGVTEPPQK
jgi:hypothetical protein